MPSGASGKYAYDHGLVSDTSITVETLGGIKVLEMETEGGKVVWVSVDMGVPEVTSRIPEPILVCGEEKEFVGDLRGEILMPCISSMTLTLWIWRNRAGF